MTSNHAPVFILGNPRSGTTLLRLMISCHPDFVIAPEGGFAVWLYAKFRNYNKQQFAEQAKSIAAEIIACKKMETWGLCVEDIASAIRDKQPSDWSEVSALVYDLYANKVEKPNARWGDKNNFYLNHVDEIVELFPRVQFVHIVRDPRHVAASYRRITRANMKSPYAPKLPDLAIDIAEQWNTNVCKILSSLEQLPSALHVRYEDLTTKPATELKRVCDYLGAPYNSDMLRFYESTARLEPAETLAWKKKTLMPARPDVPEGYLDVIDEDEAQAIVEFCSDTMNRLGY